MKKILFFLGIFLIANVGYSQHQQIENSNFENWTGSTADNWHSSFSVDLPYPLDSATIYTAEQSSDAADGQYSSKLETKSISDGSNTYIVPGLTQLGILTYDAGNVMISGGDSLYDRPLGMSIFVKYTPAENDTAFIFLYMTKYNQSNDTRDTVGGIIYPITDTILNYTELNIPVLYKDTVQGDTINIIFLSSSPFNPVEGSVLYVDSLTLLYDFVAYPTVALPATNYTDTSFTANWVQSPLSNQYFLDVATDTNFTNIVTGYDNLAVDSFLCNVIIPTSFQGSKNYYYRVRVNYGDSVASENSNVMSVKMPYSTVCLPASNITNNSFDANWRNIEEAQSYDLYVAKDYMFTNYVTGFEGMNLTDTSYTVSGLDFDSTYYYRVKTNYSFGSSGYSNTISVIILGIDGITNSYSYYIDNKILYISNLKQNSKISVFDATGRLVTKINSSSGNVSIPLNISGVYLVRILNREHNFSFKIAF